MKNPFYVFLTLIFAFYFLSRGIGEYKLPVLFPLEYSFFDLLRIFLAPSRFFKSGFSWFFWGLLFVILLLIANRNYERDSLNIHEEIWKQATAVFLSGILITVLGIFAPSIWPFLKNEREFEFALFFTGLPLSAISIGSFGMFMFRNHRA
jgi:hypothetical protein